MVGFKELIDKSNVKVLMLGNEAIARGALEAGIGVATAYPGTPSSEIVETLMEVKDELGIYVEWSINEKVAFEIAYAAAISGIRSLVAMKHVGLNVAADPFMSSAYTGVKEGFVIVSADDPSMWSSQNEQDNRLYGIHAYVPVFEPTIVNEAKDLTKYLFGLSSKHKHPIMLRSTTRISHTRTPITLGPIPRNIRIKGKFEKESRFVLIPANARRNRLDMIKRVNDIQRDLENFPFNGVEGSGSKLIIGVGISYSYVKEVLEELGLSNEVILIKLSSIYPIPKEGITKLLRDVREVLIVEELEPVVEMQLKCIVANEGLNVKVHGKDLVGLPYEMSLDRVRKSLKKFLRVDKGLGEPVTTTNVYTSHIKLPPRPPTFCPGCPYRSLFYAIRMFIIKNRLSVIASGDIGCYSLAYNKPFQLQDIIIEMGGSIGVANGLTRFTDDVVISFIGDSTFFHAGLPPLINALINGSNQIVVVLDNEVTAMTGHQPSPTTKVKGRRRILVEDIAKGVGVRFVKVVDPFNVKEVMKTLDDALKFIKENKEPAVIVAKRRCALEVYRDLRREGIVVPTYVIDENKCIACKLCYEWFGCPAIEPLPNGKAKIDPGLCVGCGACTEICPVKAIRPSRPYNVEQVKKFWF